MGFTPGTWFKIRKTTNIPDHINNKTHRNHMIISIDAEKSIRQNATLIPIKNSGEHRNKGNFP